MTKIVLWPTWESELWDKIHKINQMKQIELLNRSSQWASWKEVTPKRESDMRAVPSAIDSKLCWWDYSFPLGESVTTYSWWEPKKADGLMHIMM